MLGTGEASRTDERVHALPENYAEHCLSGIRYMGDADIYEYGAIKDLTNLKNHATMNLERFMIGAIFAVYPGLTRQRIWAIINGITNDLQFILEIEFVDKKAPCRRKNEASVIRVAVQEHRAVLGLVKSCRNDIRVEKRWYPLILRYFLFLKRELERKAEMELIW